MVHWDIAVGLRPSEPTVQEERGLTAFELASQEYRRTRKSKTELYEKAIKDFTGCERYHKASPASTRARLGEVYRGR